ncbi:MAG: hypothetical protein QXN05_00885 [Acidilobaceae archaeon]
MSEHEFAEPSEATLLDQVSELQETIMAMRDERRKLVEEVKKLRDERRKLVSERRVLIERLKEIKKELTALREEFVKLREERDKLRKEIEIRRGELKIASQLAEKEGEVARISLKRLQKRLEELEFKQMTSVLSPEEEKELVEQIAKLENLIMRVKSARRHIVSLVEFKADLKALVLQLKEMNSRLSELRQKLGGLINEKNRILEELRSYSNKIAELSTQIDNISQEIDSKNKQLDELYSRYRETLSKLRELKIARKLRLTLEALEKKRREVKEKAERGEPLTLDEMKILYGELDLDSEASPPALRDHSSTTS